MELREPRYLEDNEILDIEQMATRAAWTTDRVNPLLVRDLVATAGKARAELRRLIALANDHGWNGVENPKALWDFFESKLNGYAAVPHTPDPKDVVSGMARSLIRMMDEEPNVVNMLGMELRDPASDRAVQVTLEYVRPGNKSPSQIMNEMRDENAVLKAEVDRMMAQIRKLKGEE